MGRALNLKPKTFAFENSIAKEKVSYFLIECLIVKYQLYKHAQKNFRNDIMKKILQDPSYIINHAYSLLC